VRRVLAGLLLISGFGLLVFGFSPYISAADSLGVDVTFNILPTRELTLTTNTVTFGDVSPGATIKTSAVTVTVYSNVNYTLKCVANGDFQDSTETYTVPIGQLEYRLNGTNDFTSFSTTEATLASGSKTGGQDYKYDYRLTVNWTDPVAGGYEATITYSVGQ